MGGSDSVYRAIFLVLVVLDLVAGFQALGTLLAGVPLLLPAAAARCWAQRIGPLVGLSIGFGMCGRLCRIARVLPSQRAVGAGDRLCRGTRLRRFGSRAGKPHPDDGTQRNQADLRGK